MGIVTTSNMQTFVISNGIPADSTLRFLNNDSNGNQVITITASTAGAHEDTSNSDNVVDGDDIAHQISRRTGGTNISMSYYGALINPHRHPAMHNFFAFN